MKFKFFLNYYRVLAKCNFMEGDKIIIVGPYVRTKYFDIYIHMQIKITRCS